MKKKIIRLTEADLKDMVMQSVRRLLKESYANDEEYSFEDEDEDEEISYEMAQLQKAFQKENGTYHAKSSDGTFETGDKVVMHTKKGDIEGVIDDFDVNFMTYEETADVKYFDQTRNKEMTMIGVPLSKISKI